MKHGVQKLMIHLPYSRELSLLLCFEREGTGFLRIRAFYNGETLVQTFRYKMGRPFSLKCLSYCSYQGVLYICFGLNHPLYRFKIDEDALAKFNDEVNKVYAQKRQEIEEQERATEGFRITEAEDLPDESVTAYCHHSQIVEQVKLDHPDIFKPLFAFEALEWPVNTYTPQRLSELLQIDAEQVNEALKKASEEEKDKAPLLLRTQVIAPFANRLWGFGSPTNSHRITASAKGDFADFDVAYPSLVQARNPLSPIIGTFVSETFDPVLWAVPFGEELLVGTTDGIYVLKEGQRDKGEFVKVHKELHMGVAPIKPVVLDKALFFVEGNRKNISCLTWSRERGGYQVHSLTAYADHLFTSGIVRLEAVRTPFNMLFVLLGDGHFLTFTHDADLKILGWAQHYLGGDARIVDMCAIPTLKDDTVFFWCVRDQVEYLEVLRTGQISSHPTLVGEATYLDCSSKVQDKTEIVLDRAVQSLIDDNQFFEEVEMTPQGYSLLSKRLHHQVDRDAQQFDMKDFLIDGTPWEELPSGVFVQGTMEEDRFIPNNPVEDEAVADLLDAAPFIKGSYVDGLFMENYPIDGQFIEAEGEGRPPVEGRLPGEDPDPHFLYGKLVGADPLKWESKKFLERYFKTARKILLTDIGRWSAFLEGLQGLIHFPQDMSIQNFNFSKISKKTEQLRQILEEIRNDPNRRAWDNLFFLDHRDFAVTHKTKPYINFHSRKDLLRLKEGIFDEFHAILDKLLRIMKPFLGNIGLRNDFTTVQAFVTHINRCFLEFMAGFEEAGGDLFGQIKFLQERGYGSKNFWDNAFRFDLTSRAIFATKEVIGWLKERALHGTYKGRLFAELDTKRKVLFLKDELANLLEEREHHVRVRPQTQFVPRNMNFSFIDKTHIILDVCASLGMDINFAEAADALVVKVRDGNITPALQRAEAYESDASGESGFDGLLSVDSAAQLSDTSVSNESTDTDSGSEDDAINDEALNRAIEGGDPEAILGGAARNRSGGLQRDYNNLLLQLYTRINTVRSYIERHYLLLSDQGNAEKHVNLWAEKNTFRFFKYCFLDLKNMSLYQGLFKNVNLETYADLVQADSGERIVFTVPSLELFPASKLTLVADNGFYEQPFIIRGDQIKLTKPIKAFSIGFNYISVLKLFPLAFSEEADPIPKRNINLGIKVYNTKDGWVEEHQEDGSTVTHSLRSPALPHDHYNNHISDRGYLIKEVAAILAPPYQSGWLDIPMKETIKRDVCVTITVNTPAPFTLLKVSAKAQLLEHYKV